MGVCSWSIGGVYWLITSRPEYTIDQEHTPISFFMYIFCYIDRVYMFLVYRGGLLPDHQ